MVLQGVGCVKLFKLWAAGCGWWGGVSDVSLRGGGGSGIGVGICDCVWWGHKYMVVLGVGVGWAIDVGSLSHMLTHCGIWACVVVVVVVVDGPCRVCWVLWG